MMDSLLTNTSAWLLVFARIGGLLGMNPLLSRRNIPSMVRIGLTLLMTLLIAPGVAFPSFAGSSFELAMGILQELMIGFACGFVFQVFYYMLFFAGDLMDTQFGMSMAKVFDPGTNVQLSISGTFLNLLFVLYLFATDSHLLLIRIFAASFQVLPIGGLHLSAESAQFFINLFISVFSMALRLALPFIAAEFVLELSMGILMKLIPQIHVFVINIQFKILLGITLLLVFAGPISSFVDNYMNILFESIQSVFYVMGA